MIDLATINDLEQLDELAYQVITDMKESNIPQWEYTYPRKEHFLKDIENSALIVYKLNNIVVGCMAIYEENDPPYKTIDSWQRDHSIVLHRILVNPTIRNKGIAKQMLEYAIALGKKEGYESIKIDTHLENYKMRAFLKKHEFIEGDYIESIDRIAYEYILEESK